MSEPHVNPLLVMALSKINLVQQVEETDQVKPSPEQYGLKSGDKAVVAGTKAAIDLEFEVCEILDSSEYAQEFPDWAERLQRSYLLCRYYTTSEPLGEVGWFSRVKLIPITEEQYEEVKGWITEDDLPDVPPDWLKETYRKWDKSVARAAPDQMAIVATCESCGHEPVGLIIIHHTHGAATAGILEVDGKRVYVPLDDHGADCKMDARIYCGECEHYKELEDDEVRINTQHEFAQLLANHLGPPDM
jgi:hypothetical protein